MGMTRATRAAVGVVVGFVLLLVAGVAGLVAVVAAGQEPGVGSAFSEPVGPFFRAPVTAQAEVLDIDGEVGGEFGWATADVAFTTPDGRTEVSSVDLGPQDSDSPPLPEVGDTIDVVFEAEEPSFVLRADDPMLTGGIPDDGTEAPPSGSETQDRVEEQAALDAVVRRTGGLALVALVGALAVGVVTVLAVRRAPHQVREPDSVAVN